MPYSQMFKHKMIQKMIGSDAISATALSKQIDVPQATLSTWLRKAGINSCYVVANPHNGNMTMVPKTPNGWSETGSSEESVGKKSQFSILPFDIAQ